MSAVSTARHAAPAVPDLAAAPLLDALEWLARVAQTLAQDDDAAGLHRVFAELAAALGHEFHFHFRVVAGDDDTLVLASSGGLDATQRAHYASIQRGQYLCGRVAQGREPLVAEELALAADAAAADLCAAGVRCYVGVPLLHRGELLGTVSFATARRARLRDGELRLVQTVADLAAVHLARRLAAQRLHDEQVHVQLAMEASLAVVYEWDVARNRVRRLRSDEPALPPADADTLQAVTAVVHPDDRAAFLARVHAALAGPPGAYQSEHRVLRPDGAVIWLDERGRVEFDAAGRPVRLLGISIDITQRRRTEEALRRSEERLALAVKATQDVVWEWHAAGDRLTWSEAGRARFGWTEPSTGGVSTQWWLDRVHPQDLVHAERALREQADPQSDFVQAEYRLRCADGRYLPVVDRSYVVRDADGAALRVVGTLQDQSERRHAEAALRALNERFEAALRASQVVVFNQDRDLRYTWIHNPALGYGASQVIGRRDSDLFERAQDAAATEALKRRVMASGEPARAEVTVMAGGVAHHYDLFVQPQRDAADAVAGVTCAAVDITERRRTEDALRESERRLAGVLQAAPVGIALLDTGLRYLQINQALAVMNALPVEAHLGRPVADVLPPASAALVLPLLQQVLASGQPLLDHEVVGTGPDGQTHAFLAQFVPVRDDAGALLGVACVVADVTQRRRMALELERALARLELALRAAGLGIHDYDVASGRIEWDDTVRRLWGVGPDTPIDYPLFARGVHPEDLPAVQAAVDRALDPAGGGHYTAEFRVVHAQDGSVRWVCATGQTRFEDGRAVRVTGTVQDVSARRRADAALRESETKLRLALEAAQIGMWDWTPGADRTVWSDECCAIFGLQPHEFEGTGAHFWRLVHDDDRARVQAAVRRAGEQRARYESEFRIVRPDGELRWVAHVGRMLYDADGRALRMIGTALDVTERRRAEEQLHDEARRKDEFLAMLAHEMRNPLAPIRNAVAVLQQRAADDRLLARCRDIIDRQAAQLARLLDDLLDVSRLARGKLGLQRGRVPLKAVLDDAVDTVRPLVDQRGQRLVLPEVDPALVLDGDAARLTQVFANLLHNAAKYGHPGGRIELSVRREDEAVCVAVRDDGIGIPKEMLAQVFDLFVQGSDARSHAPGGLGIGLSLASRLVQMHGGRLTATSDGAGRGSEFCVTLPLPDAAASAAPPLAETQPPALPRRRVLICDDNRDAADTTGLLLSALGCDVGVVYDGETALREAERQRPEVVLLDLGMQGIDGYEVCRRLRSQPWGMGITLVALSGWGQDEDRRRSAKAGFDRHLTKPASPDELIAAVREAQPLEH